MPVYNAIVKKHDGNVIKYRNISNIENFISAITSRNAVRIMYLYSRISQKDKRGQYIGYWQYLTGYRQAKK